MKIKDQIIRILLFCFVLLIPFWRLGTLFSFILVLILSLPKIFKKINYSVLFFFPLVLYHLILISFKGFYFNDFKHYYDLLSILLIVPLLLDKLKVKHLFQSIQVFVFSVFVVHLYTVFNIIRYFIVNNELPVLRSSANVNNILILERPYLGFFSIIAILFSSKLFMLYKKKIYPINIVFAVFIILIISARLATVLLIVFAVFYSFISIKRVIYKYLFLIGLFLGLFFLATGNSTLNHRFIQIKDDSRVLIWKNAHKIIKEKHNYFFGSNNRDIVIKDLKEKFKSDANLSYKPKKDRFLKANYNTHNQFLDELIIGGIFGLILFLLPFIILLKKSYFKKNYVNILLLISMLTFLFVENVFERQTGVFLFGYLLIVLGKNILYKTNLRGINLNLKNNFPEKYKKIIYALTILCILIFIVWFGFRRNSKTTLKNNINEIELSINKIYKIGDVRRYGIFPDKPIGQHPISKKSKMETLFDIAESGIDIYFPKGFYRMPLNLFGRNHIKIHFDDCTFDNLIQIREKENIKSSNIEFTGTLTSLVKFYIRNSNNVKIEKLIIKSDTINSINHKRSFGVSIHQLTKNLEIGDLIVEDLGSYGKDYKYTRAAVEIHGLNNEPEDIKIKNIIVKSSDRSGVYISGNKININTIEIEKFGLGSKKYMVPLEGGIEGEEILFSGIWLNKCYNSNITNISINLDESKGTYSAYFDFGQSFRAVNINNLTINKNGNSKISIKKLENSGVKIKTLQIND